MMTRMNGPQTLKAILTDIQFWIPATVLAAGIALLVILH
ncbi:translocated intimin receptor Tir [Granulicella arctica]|nr:translocated intimin receptor Tir [Granulicella arctica]